MINDAIAFVNGAKQAIADCGAGVTVKLEGFNPL
jgi:hypothetical protein